MNLLTIAGHLGADPEVRFTSSGQKLTVLRVAARLRKTQNDPSPTVWWRVTVWGENFDKMISYLKKGSAVIVMGEMAKPEIFTNRDGNPQISMAMTASNVMFSPFGRSSNERGKENNQTSQEKESSKEEAYAGFANGEAEGAKDTQTDDDIPF